MEPPDDGMWITIAGAVGGILGAILGFLGQITTASVNSKASLDAAINTKIEALIKGYESLIKELEAENVRLNKKVAELEKGKCRDE